MIELEKSHFSIANLFFKLTLNFEELVNGPTSVLYFNLIDVDKGPPLFEILFYIVVLSGYIDRYGTLRYVFWNLRYVLVEKYLRSLVVLPKYRFLL